MELNSRNILYMLNFIELELRSKKYIKLSNLYASICDGNEYLSDKNENSLIDKIWGCNKLYNFGYTNSPIKSFFKIEIYLIICGFLMFFILDCSITKATYQLCINQCNRINLYLFNTHNCSVFDFLSTSVIPSFKLVTDTTNKISLSILEKAYFFISNTISSLNLIGLGITLKRRFSRNNS